MFLWLLLVLLPLAVAGDDGIRVTLVVDDREAQRLSAAQVVVEEQPPVTAPLKDDGSCAGDMPGDHILTACFDIRRRETLSFGVIEGGDRLGAFNLFLPNASQATVSLRARAGSPALLVDMAAEQPRYSAPEGPGSQDRPKDKILVMLGLEARTGRTFVAPRLRPMDREDGEPVQASDAGLLLGDRAGDGLWRADLTVVRTETLTLGLFDGGELLGEVELPLPERPRAFFSLSLGEDGLSAQMLDRVPSPEDGPMDRVLLMLSIDDGASRSLAEPILAVVDREGVEPVAASDAGLLLGDVFDDGIWRADVSVVRTDEVTLRLLDGEVALGEVTVPIPARPRVAYTLRVLEGEPGLAAVLEQELPSVLSPDDEVEGLTETSLLRVSIQDSTDRPLQTPVLSIEGQEGVEPVAASDEGLLQDDEAGDGTWRADVTVLRTPTVTLALEDGEVPLGKATFSLPAAREVAVSLVRKGDPARLVVTTEAISSLGDQDSMVLVVELDDRAASLLEAPVVSIDQGAVEPARALDDGSIPGDVADDGIFMVELEVVRNPRVVITVRDGETLLGSVDAPLPASDSTTVRLRTRHGDPAVALIEELDMSGGGSGGGGGGGGGNLWLLVWLNIGLFVVLFAWVRRAVRRAIDRELGAREGAPPPADEP
jgi:hypothetical protein